VGRGRWRFGDGNDDRKLGFASSAGEEVRLQGRGGSVRLTPVRLGEDASAKGCHTRGGRHRQAGGSSAASSGTSAMTTLVFDPIGIGDLLRKHRLTVPPNQRSYAWEYRNVKDLLEDIQAEMSKERSKGPPEYFLGTVVLVKPKEDSFPQISDGQQRIATTSIILARIRDILHELGRQDQASSIQQEYVFKIDLDSGDKLSQVSLNKEDNAFFSDVILAPYPHRVSPQGFLRQSNKLLLKASEIVYDYFQGLIRSYPENARPQVLIAWVKFLKSKTTVVAVTVPDENQAFRLFETLNDRGVKAGQVDILKNFFLQQTSDRLGEIHAQWTELGGKIESSFPDNDDQLMLYVRHLWIAKHGHTIEKRAFS
jgi:Protein of unknown function DUF262